MMSKLLNAFVWGSVGAFSGHVSAVLLLQFYNNSRDLFYNRDKVAYFSFWSVTGFIMGSVRGYTGKSVVELLLE